jgi:hypothetical protein
MSAESDKKGDAALAALAKYIRLAAIAQAESIERDRRVHAAGDKAECALADFNQTLKDWIYAAALEMDQ